MHLKRKCGIVQWKTASRTFLTNPIYHAIFSACDTVIATTIFPALAPIQCFDGVPALVTTFAPTIQKVNAGRQSRPPAAKNACCA